MSAKVTLLTYTPEPEKTVAMAAKLCYAKSDIDTIRDGLTEEKISSFVDMLAQIGHESPIEHISFTFGIEGISRACSHQLVRHRIASYSQQSQRYVDGTSFDYVTPPSIKENSALLEKYNKAVIAEMEEYRQLRDALIAQSIRTYKCTCKEANIDCDGRDDTDIIEDFKKSNRSLYSKFEKTANEDARFLLPNACTTKIVCTFNARSLMNFFSHRCCNRAQWEIREVAEQMLALVKPLAPSLFKHAGPPCIRGACPEGKMSCGKVQQMREKYLGGS